MPFIIHIDFYENKYCYCKSSKCSIIQPVRLLFIIYLADGAWALLKQAWEI